MFDSIVGYRENLVFVGNLIALLGITGALFDSSAGFQKISDKLAGVFAILLNVAYFVNYFRLFNWETPSYYGTEPVVMAVLIVVVIFSLGLQGFAWANGLSFFMTKLVPRQKWLQTITSYFGLAAYLVVYFILGITVG